MPVKWKSKYQTERLREAAEVTLWAVYYCEPKEFLIKKDSFSILYLEDIKKKPLASIRPGATVGVGSTGEAASKTPD